MHFSAINLHFFYMYTFNTDPLRKFISSNGFDKTGKLVLFNAVIHYHSGGNLQTIASQVQIITLPQEIAVYILEFINEAYGRADMYSTSHYHFKCPGAKELQIFRQSTDAEFILSIIPF